MLCLPCVRGNEVFSITGSRVKRTEMTTESTFTFINTTIAKLLLLLHIVITYYTATVTTTTNNNQLSPTCPFTPPSGGAVVPLQGLYIKNQYYLRILLLGYLLHRHHQYPYTRTTTSLPTTPPSTLFPSYYTVTITTTTNNIQ